MFRIIFSSCLVILCTSFVFAQTSSVEGYIYESGNRGYLSNAKVDLKNAEGTSTIQTTMTNSEGYFEFQVDRSNNYTISVSKNAFEGFDMMLNMADYAPDEKIFLKVEMKRAPGYQFEITLAPKRESDDIAVDAIRGALIEVYNNTTQEVVMVLKDHPSPEFAVNLIKGNHYTILVRSDGYLAKRMEAFVDVEGCILCFEGIGSVTPGVVDNLTEGNEMGVLLANVEMEQALEGKRIEIKNIYYDYGSADLRPEGKDELGKVATLLKDNPNLSIELGSHTDSRGKADQNQVLSLKRAKSAVDYLVDRKDINKAQIVARGYGESRIKNDCVDGADCSEAEHQENRRTELTIMGFRKVQEFKSLEQFKKEEQMEALIADLGNQQQIKVTGDQTIDDVIGTTEGKQDPVVQKSIEQRIEETVKEETVKEEPVYISSSEDPQPTESATEVTPTEEIPTETTNPYSYIDGPKIVIRESSEYLQETDDIFVKHEQVFQFLQGNKILYMIGDFDSMNAAKGFLGSAKMMYPDAYILNFDKGVIID